MDVCGLHFKDKPRPVEDVGYGYCNRDQPDCELCEGCSPIGQLTNFAGPSTSNLLDSPHSSQPYRLITSF